MKNLIISIPIILILSACCSFNNDPLAQAKVSYEDGKYLEAHNLCEIKLFSSENNSINEIKGEWFLNPSSIPSRSNCRSLDTIDDTWLLDYMPSEKEKKQREKRKKLKEELKEFDNIILQELKAEEITIPAFAKYLESLARKNDPDKRDMEISYAGKNPEKYEFMTIDFGRISLSDAIVFIFGLDDYEIMINGNEILIKSREVQDKTE